LATPPIRRYWHIFDFFSIVICLTNESRTEILIGLCPEIKFKSS